MAGYPVGLAALDPVTVPHTAVPRVAFHRPVPPSGCGSWLCTIPTALAVGMGCVPCPDCWPAPTAPAPRLLRPAVPRPASTGRRVYDGSDPARPAYPAAA
ncbi:hypothetical protein ABZ671_00445 [Micromonospora sp. NPDC006766]|uniref:hypothetical protein n=1 Tax=Micromonospora sp. NPDC006766 TaxID=3154778 RepID=UPI0033CCCEDE